MPDKTDAGMQFNRSLAYGAVLGQVGCLTLAIVIGAMLGGIWLDRQFNTRALFTVLLMVGSVPVTIYLMFRVVWNATARIRSAASSHAPQQSVKEDRNGDISS